MNEAALVKKLLSWYRREARDLPWRRTRDPYRIWVSEVILQQTRVEQGIEQFVRFLDAFPTVEALAAASLDDVLKVWEGFGYYARARNLHKAAQRVVSELDGRLPKHSSEWLALPGIGRYASGAITSIAFGERIPAVDGNCRRVLARLFNVEGCIDEKAIQDTLDTIAARLVPARRPGDFNQAIMDLGARICIPGHPRCDECPVAKHCQAYAASTQDRIPLRKTKPERPHRVEVVAVVTKRGRYLIGKRQPGGLLGGLWEFPSVRPERGESHERALHRLAGAIGVRMTVGDQISTVNHAYSHFSVTLHVYACRHIEATTGASLYEELKWTTRSDLTNHAFPGANRKFMTALRK